MYAGAAIGLTDADGDTETSGMYRFFAGYRLLDFLALEVAALGFGNLESELGNASSDVEGYEYGIVGIFPFKDTHEVYLRLGMSHWEADTQNGESGLSLSLIHI